MTPFLWRACRIAYRLNFSRWLITCGVLSATIMWAQTAIVTWHYDNARSGANTNEARLTPANVNVNSFGKLFSKPVDGFIVGHPLYLPGISIPGAAGVHNVVYVATLNDTVYAFDANDGSAPALWTRSLLDYSAAGATPVPISVKGCASTVRWTQTGVISTPVIDQGTGTLYLVAETYESGNVVHRMHALDVTTGTERPGWPATIAASYTQNGIPSTFVDTHQMNRPGLLLSNGHVYVAFGGSSCNGADHGWVMSYNAATAQQEGAFDVEPGTGLASIWQKGAGISADPDGNIYAETGEGAVQPETNLGSSVFKLSQVSTRLSLTDWFTPWNWATLNSQDLDLNNGVVILPDQSGTVREAVTMGKEGTIYVLDRDHMGNLCSSCSGADPQIVQELPQVAPSGFTPVVWNSSVYITGGSKLQIYALSNGLLTPGNSVVVGSMTHPMITANGTKNGIVWMVNSANLTARDALSLGTLYTSAQAPNGRDALPPYAHFASPIAADGQVFIGTQSSLVVYGLLPVLAPAGGNHQSATVASPLPVALEVRAKNATSAKAIAGVTVNFSDGGKGGVFGSPTGVTNSQGYVSTTYTLPTRTGQYTVTASAPSFAPATLLETAVPGAPAVLVNLSGKGQTAPAGTRLPAPLVVKVRDSYANGVPKIAVTFSDGGAGGKFSANPVITNSTGQASVLYTAGTKAGSVKVQASVVNLRSVVFAESVTAGSASALGVVSGNGQSAPVSSALPEPLVVQVTDGFGNPVSGASVQFSDGGRGGVFTASPLLTDATGKAAASYTTPPTTGAVTIQATVGGVRGTAVFSVTVN
jgi:hypothetical protein